MKLICEYCKHEFVKPKYFEDHFCEHMQKMEIFKLPVGKSAFYYYKEWLKLSNKNINISEETFLKSRYFLSFIKFVKFSNRMMLPDQISYIKYMISLSMLPIHWCMNDLYINYIKDLDTMYTPIQQIDITRKTLTELSVIFNCTVENIFEYLQAGDCIKLLKSRKLSPWLLLLSSKFHQYLIFKLTVEQRILITQTIINPVIWKEKFNKNFNIVKLVKEIIAELKL